MTSLSRVSLPRCEHGFEDASEWGKGATGAAERHEGTSVGLWPLMDRVTSEGSLWMAVSLLKAGTGVTCPDLTRAYLTLSRPELARCSLSNDHVLPYILATILIPEQNQASGTRQFSTFTPAIPVPRAMHAQVLKSVPFFRHSYQHSRYSAAALAGRSLEA